MQQRTAGQPLRVALLGYGLAGVVFHAPLLASTPGVTITGIMTNNAERQAQARHDFPDAHILQHVSEIQRDQYDFAVIATTNRFHASLAESLLRAGIPVVVDKPLASSVAEAEAMIATSEATGMPLSVFQNRRWDGDFMTVRQVIAAGELGSIARFVSRFERFRATPKVGSWRELPDPAEGGGLLFDLGSHLIDQAIQLFGAPHSVYAEVRITRPEALVDDDTFVSLHFGPDGTGPIAHLWMSAIAAIPGPRFLVQGARGSYAIDELDPQEPQLKAGLRPGDSGYGVNPHRAPGKLVIAGADDEPVTREMPTLPGTYQQFYAGFRDTLLHGTPPPVDPRDSLRVLRVIAAAQQSATSHQVVTL